MTRDLRHRIANDRHLGAAFESVGTSDGGKGLRTLAIHPSGGVHTRVLVDRGLDLGAAWVAGEPVSWTSVIGEQSRSHIDAGEGWHKGWAGGLLTTSGPRHIGAPRDGSGRHGTHTDNAAYDVRTEILGPDHDPCAVRVQGTIRDSDALDPGLVTRRTIDSAIGTPRISIRDEVTNKSPDPIKSPLLYHINLGYPFVDDGTTVEVGDEVQLHMGPPTRGPDSLLVLARASGDNGAIVRSANRSARISWSSSTLPWLNIWARRTPGIYVLAIEPANQPVDSPLTLDECAIEPDETRLSEVTIEFF